MNPQRERQGIRGGAQSSENRGNDMNVELNGLVIEPEVVERDEIGGATEVAVDVLYRSGENSLSFMIELEGMCESLVEIVAEEGHVYLDLYRDWSQEQPERIEICTYYALGKEINERIARQCILVLFDDPKTGWSRKPIRLKLAENNTPCRPRHFTSHTTLRQSKNKADGSGSPMWRFFHSFFHRRKDQPWRPREPNSASREPCAIAELV